MCELNKVSTLSLEAHGPPSKRRVTCSYGENPGLTKIAIASVRFSLDLGELLSLNESSGQVDAHVTVGADAFSLSRL